MADREDVVGPMPSTVTPDIMNDPDYDPNNGGEDGMGDVSLCRICRGEGSDAEPLFHPCKCSGSIKYVHQDCLMEWLSHSQKKHCELCKTPFRFTKLYSPNMPQSLPIFVLIRHVVLHSLKNMGTWLRFCLVVTVWLGVLPFTIRQVWRLLFWFSDGGWPTNAVLKLEKNSSSMGLLRQLQVASLAENGTSPASPLQAKPTSPAGVAGIVDIIIGLFTPVTQTLNISATDPLASGLVKTLSYALGMQAASGKAVANQHLGDVSITTQPSSLLSEVSFLQNLTRHSAINQLVITITEGYVITFLVVFCFILVFLIREWVVQQQPGINMGAGFNAEFAAAAPDRPREVQVAPEEPQELLVDRDEIRRLREQRDIGQRRVARARRRARRAPEEIVNHENPEDPIWEDVEENSGGVSSATNRPAPIRDALSPAAEIQRVLTEEPRMTEEFLAIWRRADSNPREVLRIIERENKGDQMRYWVNAMRILQNPIQSETPLPPLPPSSSDFHNEHPFQSSASSSVGSADARPSSGHSSAEKWVDIEVEETSDSRNDRNITLNDPRDSDIQDNFADKGKGIALDESESEDTDDLRYFQTRWPGSESTWRVNRPRSVSDGPPILDSRSPLSRDSWTFSNLTDDEDEIRKSVVGELNLNTDLEVLKEEEEETQSQTSGHEVEPTQAINKDENLQNATNTQYTSGTTGHNPGQFEENGPVEVIGTDGVTRVHEDWDEVFERNPVGGFGSDTDQEHEPVLPPPQEATLPRPAEPQGVLGAVADFLWGGIGDDRNQDEPGPNDEHIVQNLADEAPFVPVAQQDPFQALRNGEEHDQEVLEAAIAAGLDPNDPDAIDDAEDFEGIMELIGMRGPIWSLVQNALFSAFLLALTVAFGVWIPYNIGRVSILLIANPGPAFKLPLRFIFGCAAFLQDIGLVLLGLASSLLLSLISLPLKLWNYYSSGATLNYLVTGGVELGEMALSLSISAGKRIERSASASLIDITKSDIFAFSAASHESLLSLKSLLANALISIGTTVSYFLGDHALSLAEMSKSGLGFLSSCWLLLKTLPSFLARSDSWVISLEVGKRAAPLDLDLSVWGGTDRFWAITAGYTVICILGAMYVSKGTPFSASQLGRDWEASIIDLLNQAGGVLKVILIISIEMLVFPLYCGLLLDAALLPLFDNATLVSRILFTAKSPCTSMFVHWFVGTCYMFHFALFVSMCRKIMRKGVLYFIRDPDDPTFHPVRDVLERNVATQLRKILFSALVYGGLVVICLGGVVWGLAYALNGVLPIHWSSNEPVLEFPIDLLFYNFLMPLAVKFFKPSDGLHSMYAWWFRKCARILRLTWFMFDERKLDEEGHIVRRTWGDFLRRATGDPEKKINPKNKQQPFLEDPDLKAYVCQDGCYVRAPASDQVRIPKGTKIFLEVDEKNRRLDKKRDRSEGVHGSKNEQYKQVYIPPLFKLRISLFIISIWLFAAATGVSITIVPLVFGRFVFAAIIPPHVRQNDVYAFSIGIYILGSALYAMLHVGTFFSYLKTALAIDANTPYNVLRRISTVAFLVARIAWTYTAFLFVLPTLYAFVVEMYFITPLHTYFLVDEQHVIHFVQSWTLGLLYVKLTTRLILWHEDSRPARSLRAITEKGYLNPDARLATRSFILPATLVLGSALFWPWIIAKMAVMTVLKESPERHVLVYRYAYPMTFCSACILYALSILVGWLKDWRMKIRDEVYLIGERLHNFGDRKVVPSGVSVPNLRRLDT